MSFSHPPPKMAERAAIDPDWLKDQLEMPGRSQSGLARFMRLSSAAIVNRMTKGERRITAEEADKIRSYLAATDKRGNGRHMGNTPDLPPTEPRMAYLEVEVLPTFAGMGGGGTGDADQAVALLPRYLIEDELHAKPEDLLMINVRGDSMVDPETGQGFHHGDQLLVDRRDRNPRQAGPFALWYDDGYVVKNIERLRGGRLRIFSNNPKYSADEADLDDVTIMGRPVWFARRL